MQIKLKPWGKEIWFAHNSRYAAKILCVKRGHRLSLQYHERKTETQYTYKGKIRLTYGKNQKRLKTKILRPGDKFDIPPYTIHRIEALENSEIFEVSTPELTDVVRLADDYHRPARRAEKYKIIQTRDSAEKT
ncbi:cupin [Candidatus Peregrinibacteria bacterium]|nr:cupin [Candidatus Peregrinibacteria bacterium]